MIIVNTMKWREPGSGAGVSGVGASSASGPELGAGSASEAFVAAVVQAAPVYLDRARSVDKAVDLIGQAAGGGARIVAFPELWLPGYPWWVWLAESGWSEAHGLPARYREQAFVHDSPDAQRLAEAARRHGVILVMGFVERDRDSLYIGQWIVDEHGRTLARRRKLKPGPLERQVFGEGDAGDLRVVDTSVGRLGALCCAEHRSPLLKQALHSQVEDLHVAAWPSFAVQNFPAGLSPETYLAITRTYATEGGCHVLAPSAPVTAEMLALLCDTPEKRSKLGLGGGYSQIFAPNGDPLCEPLAHDREGILYATIEPAKSRQARAGFDLTGHSSRDDVVHLAWAGAGGDGPVRSHAA